MERQYHSPNYLACPQLLHFNKLLGRCWAHDLHLLGSVSFVYGDVEGV